MRSSIPKECNWIVIFDELCKKVCEVDNATVITPEKRDKDHYNEHYNNSNWNRNYVLDNYEFKDGDWIHFLDDDNSIHPDWYKNVEKCTSTDYTMAVWGQLKSDGKTTRLPASRNNLLERNFPIACRKIDTACFMVNYKHVKDIRWATVNNSHVNDYFYRLKDIFVDNEFKHDHHGAPWRQAGKEEYVFHPPLGADTLFKSQIETQLSKKFMPGIAYAPAVADSIYAERCSKIGENYYIPEYICYYNRWQGRPGLKMEPTLGFEPRTDGLQNRCSAELS